jgi:energy-coupling factor transport system permease protein
MAAIIRTLKFDPRTELVLLVLANFVAFTQRSLIIEIVLVTILLALITVCGCEKSTGKLGIAFIVCLILHYYIFPNGPKILASSFTFLVSYARKIFPCLIIGTLIVKKTSIRELMLALRKWRVPQNLIIPLSVTLRYFPALKEESGYIRDAMKLRNIHGARKIECMVVPVMISATTTAEELSAAAVTRGIESPKPKTSLVDIRFGIQDILCLFFGALFTVAVIITR